MKTYQMTFLSLVILALAPFVRCAVAEEHFAAEREARLLLAEVDQDLLLEQYRHLQMEAFKARLEMEMARIKQRNAPDQERSTGLPEKMLAAHEERVHFLERSIDEKRNQIIRLHLEWAALEEGASRKAESHGDAEASALEGTWIGHEQGKDLRFRLLIAGDHARLDCPQEGRWYEGAFLVEPEGETLLGVQFQIEQCGQVQYQGKTALGLARLEDGRLRLAANEPGNPSRPSRLEPSDETRVFVFERE